MRNSYQVMGTSDRRLAPSRAGPVRYAMAEPLAPAMSFAVAAGAGVAMGADWLVWLFAAA